MGKSLVIVESPAKAKTISKILGTDFQVKASVGHVRDLPKNKLGVNVRKNFEPQYEILQDKESIVKELREAAEKADKVYLAPDPDREGEAIAWHLSEILDIPAKKLHRVEFNEITKEAVLAAIKKPRHIDGRLVDAQQARRLLDRLVGYKISPLLWRKIHGRSAGRVQSVAVRIICERECEIEKFEAKEYWSLKADFNKARVKQAFKANLVKYDGKRIIAASDKSSSTTMIIDSEKACKKITGALEGEEFTVSSVSQKNSQRQPQAPFITSTLQRESANTLGFTVKKTMQIAQSLYEGVELGSQGPSGLITYMRTDSTRVSQQAQEEAKEYILEKHGKKYYPDKPRIYERKGKSIQDAHEAIRPTSAYKTPENLKQYLSADQFKVYKLIWERFIASQMTAVELTTRAVEISAGKGVFRASASEITFPGYTIVLNRESKENEDEDEMTDHLPELAKGDSVKLKALDPKQHFTQPPPRFSEASLVKTLEELGIGRPSTYAATVATIIDRKYVERQQKTLLPTKLGRKVNELLVEHFGNIVDVGFTAEMEAKLDQIEDDKVDWHGMLKDFYKPFGETLKKAEESMKKIVILADPPQYCENCSLPMAVKSSRFGLFLGCTNHPECSFKIALTRDGQPVPPDRPSEEPCKKCSQNMVIKYGPYGDYLFCEPCNEKQAIVKSTGVMCQREGCGGEIVEKKSRRGKMFYGCSHYGLNKCTMAYWYPPLLSGGPEGSTACPKCKALLLYKTLKRGDQLACSNKECDFTQLATGKETHA